MVDNIVKVASILSQPDLEEETKIVINLFIRNALVTPTKEPKTFSPFDPVRSKAEEMLGAGVVSEWMDGKKEGEQ